MFNLKSYILRCVMGMIGNEADYKVMEYSLGWFQKGVLTEEDLATIEAKIAEHNVEIAGQEAQEEVDEYDEPVIPSDEVTETGETEETVTE